MNEFLNKYMPQTMATLPESAWKETLINGKIYMVPRSTAAIFPDKLPIEVYDLANSSRAGALKAAGLRNSLGAPVYLAWFDWQGPLFDGRVHAMHTMDIAFWFMNTELQVSHTGGGQYPRNLAKKMAKALNNFMRTGDPNGRTGLQKGRTANVRERTVCGAAISLDRPGAVAPISRG